MYTCTHITAFAAALLVGLVPGHVGVPVLVGGYRLGVNQNC